VREDWIASSQVLLAMTAETLHVIASEAKQSRLDQRYPL